MSGGVLITEWIERFGGAEKVWDALLEAFPDADRYCLWNDQPATEPNQIAESWLSRTPFRRHKAIAVPAMLPTWRRLPGRYTWALTASHLFAHHAAFPNASDHLRKYAYVHTPARYIWDPDADARAQIPTASALASPLRALDRRRAQELHKIAGNSNWVKTRIQKSWDRDADVIYPPVEVSRLIGGGSWENHLTASDAGRMEQIPDPPFIVGASRLVRYKKLDEVIRTGQIVGLPVVLAGSGPDEQRLRHLASSASVPVTIVCEPSDELLFAIIQAAALMVYPAIEDFGILPVEAMALGTPVLARALGGQSETIRDALSGALIESFEDAAQVRGGVDRALRANGNDCTTTATRFDRARFVDEMRGWLDV